MASSSTSSKKGDIHDVDANRGLLLADHAGKGFLAQVKQHIDPLYNAGMPKSQYGAVPKRGTDFAHHILQSFIATSVLSSSSVFILFVDLIKAFDRALRELVFGMPPSSSTSPTEHFISMGITHDDAAWLGEFVSDHGAMFTQWSVDPKVRAMARNLHDGAWFKIGSSPDRVVPATGGRQGCKLGSVVFNTKYAIALFLLEAELGKADLGLKVRSRSGEFWSDGTRGADDEDKVIDVAFVDDLCIMLSARGGASLDVAIEIVLSTLIRIFSLLQLDINWAKGKTECLLMYRGKKATQFLDKRRIDGKLWVTVGAYPAVRVHVVSTYKHLGAITSLRGACIADAKSKCEVGLSAYCPISTKIFASPHVTTSLKLVFMNSLVLSRVLFHIHVLVPTHRHMQVINAVYMRVARRIAGKSRYDADTESDYTVRQMLGIPSLDCLVQQARLRYLRRILVNKPTALQAILGFQHEGRRLPWADLIVDDMRCLRSAAATFADMPEPDAQPGLWYDRIVADEQGWFSAVHALRYLHSACDRHKTDEAAAAGARIFGCDICAQSGETVPAFGTLRALKSHQRAKHGIRTPMRFYVKADGKCICCGTVFHTRLRCIAHLADTRRDKCWLHILATRPPRLPTPTVEALDALDREQRKMAFKKGHTHPLAQGSAITKHGKRIGHVGQ